MLCQDAVPCPVSRYKALSHAMNALGAIGGSISDCMPVSIVVMLLSV